MALTRILTGGLMILLLVTWAGCGGDSSGGGGGGGFTGTLDEAQPGTSTLDATARCIGIEWAIAEDLNANAAVSVAYKKTSTGTWSDAMDLRRVRREHMTAALQPASNEVLHAGSIFNCDEGTDYDVRLTLTDPDGGGTTRDLTVTTWAEPDLASPVQTFYVIPGSGGGSGTSGNPFQGIAAAEAAAAPGVLFLLRDGTYTGRWNVSASGTPAQPIKWAADAGHNPILDAGLDGRSIHIENIHDVIIEGLELRDGDYGIMLRYSQGITLRRLYIHNVKHGIDGSFNNGLMNHIWISDCTIEGTTYWPRDASDQDWRGIKASGEVFVACHNRVKDFWDGIDVSGTSAPNRNIDFYLNDISECVDDGIELDFSDQNCRAFENRLTNCLNVISFQPIYGGPAYAVRNMVYNYVSEPYKLHNGPSGAVLLHNTYVKDSLPLQMYSGATVYNVLAMNNLYVADASTYGIEWSAPAVDVFMDYDVFCGGPFGNFGKWGGDRYGDPAEFFAGTGMEQYGVESAGADVFVSGVLPPADSSIECALSLNDLRPASGQAMVDAGAVIDNINDGYAGAAPDAGCLEYGEALPPYGPR